MFQSDDLIANIHTKPTVAPAPQRSVASGRFILVWTLMLGSMIVFWCFRPFMTAVDWINASFSVLWTTSKVTTLIWMRPTDRRRLGWVRIVAYVFWPGMQPQHFLPERKPADARPAPSVRGLILNCIAAVLFLWIIPYLIPAHWPRGLLFASAITGYVFLTFFAVCDAWAMVFRACGIGVEKLWYCPLAATSLTDFWGHRWNRVFSGMLREVLFLPLARRCGPTIALIAVFIYSGLMHENFSVGAWSGFGLPTLYFLIQATGRFIEGRPSFRQQIRRRPWLGRLWTTTVVLAPVLLLLNEGIRERVLIPLVAQVGVPGLEVRPS